MSAKSKSLSRARLINVAVTLTLVALAALLAAWQSGPWWFGAPRPGRWIGATVCLLAYCGVSGWLLWRARPERTAQVPPPIQQTTVLVAHGSQTGFAIELAARTAQSLSQGGLEAQVLSIGGLDAKALSRYRRALFVVSTTGEGDPPDLALGFAREVMGRSANLNGLQYAVLALGDASYKQYCAFGRQLEHWLRTQGATPLFDRVEVDNADGGALRHWQHHLALLAGIPDLSDWNRPSYQAWTLRERRLLNPGSVGGQVYHMALTPPAQMPDWQAGDLVEVGPRHRPGVVTDWLKRAGLEDCLVMVDQASMPLSQALACRQLPDRMPLDPKPQPLVDSLPLLPHREYSIASLPADGALHLLLRRMQRPDGSVGLASGWLCEHAALGSPIALRLRTNPNFHPPAPDTPMILIGNGTGIASLRALLKSRIAAGARCNWLLFGERQRAHDFHYGDQFSAWFSQGWLARMDLAFSRDGAEHHYVQDALHAAAGHLQTWIADGAAVYVCGSLQGMAPEVDAVLQQSLGEATMETLRLQGRYRRDVY